MAYSKTCCNGFTERKLLSHPAAMGNYPLTCCINGFQLPLLSVLFVWTEQRNLIILLVMGARNMLDFFIMCKCNFTINGFKAFGISILFSTLGAVLIPFP